MSDAPVLREIPLGGVVGAQVVAALGTAKFRFAHEDDLQAGIAQHLVDVGMAVEREVRLDAHSRIDFMVDGHIGIEAKTAGAVGAVRRQLQRYAGFPQLDALILVTTRMQHARALSGIEAFGSTRFFTFYLSSASL